MERQNLFSDVWDGESEEFGTGGTGSSGGRTTRAWGRRCTSSSRARPTAGCTCTSAPRRCSSSSADVRRSATSTGKRCWRPATTSSALRGGPGLHTFSNPTDEPAQILAMSAGALPRCRRLSRGRVRVGGDPRPRSRAAREGRRPRDHRPVRDPDRVGAARAPGAHAETRRPRSALAVAAEQCASALLWCSSRRFLTTSVQSASTRIRLPVMMNASAKLNAMPPPALVWSMQRVRDGEMVARARDQVAEHAAGQEPGADRDCR